MDSMDDLEAYRIALKERVCKVCVDRLDDGSCGLRPGRICALEMHLPRIVRAVQSVRSNYVSDYVDEIRQIVCAHCPNEESGTCHYRENWDCSLDNFVSLVVDAIESVDRPSVTSAVPA